MKSRARKNIGAIVAVVALGIGAFAYVLRAAPVVREAIAGLRTSPADPNVPASGASPDPAQQQIARNALLVTGPAGTSAGATLASAPVYKDGKFQGRRQYAFYGYLRVQAVVKNGVMSDVQVLEYPNDNGRSHYINGVALPYLIQEAVDAQTYKVDLISGATFTSVAFVKSLQDALRQAGA